MYHQLYDCKKYKIFDKLKAKSPKMCFTSHLDKQSDELGDQVEAVGGRSSPSPISQAKYSPPQLIVKD